VGRQADWDAAKRKYPSTVELDQAAWIAFFDQRPDVMHAIIGDVAKVVQATERDHKRAGRRPAVRGGTMDDLDRLIRPRFSLLPFDQAVQELIGTRSVRAFAAKVPIHHTTLVRMMSGDRQLNMPVLEAIATAGNVTPFYFAEYRTLWVADAFTKVFASKPNLSIRAIKQLSAARPA